MNVPRPDLYRAIGWSKSQGRAFSWCCAAAIGAQASAIREATTNFHHTPNSQDDGVRSGLQRSAWGGLSSRCLLRGLRAYNEKRISV